MRKPNHIAADTRIVKQSTMTQATETVMRKKNMEQFMNRRIEACVLALFVINEIVKPCPQTHSPEDPRPNQVQIRFKTKRD